MDKSFFILQQSHEVLINNSYVVATTSHKDQ